MEVDFNSKKYWRVLNICLKVCSHRHTVKSHLTLLRYSAEHYEPALLAFPTRGGGGGGYFPFSYGLNLINEEVRPNRAWLLGVDISSLFFLS